MEHFVKVFNCEIIVFGCKTCDLSSIHNKTFYHNHRESWEKENVNWLDEGKQVRFGQRKTFKFRDDLSVSDEDTSLTLLNLPMMVSTGCTKLKCAD